MPLNERVLADILLELTETIEGLVHEVERLSGAIYEDDRLRERYLVGVRRPRLCLKRMLNGHDCMYDQPRAERTQVPPPDFEPAFSGAGRCSSGSGGP